MKSCRSAIVGSVGAGLRALAVMSAYLCALCCLVAPLRAHAQDERSPAGLETTLAVQLGYPFGSVQVGENQYPGNRLTFHGDLGVDLSEAVTLGLRYRFTPEDAVHVSFQMLFLDGSTTLPRDTFFNGTKLQGGTTLDTTTNFPTLSPHRHVRALPAALGDGTVTGRRSDLRRAELRLHGTGADSPGNETGGLHHPGAAGSAADRLTIPRPIG
jgi:hypothetical protein